MDGPGPLCREGSSAHLGDLGWEAVGFSPSAPITWDVADGSTLETQRFEVLLKRLTG